MNSANRKSGSGLCIVYVNHSAREAMTRMKDSQTNYLGVVDGDALVGVVARSALADALKTREHARLHDIMETEVPTVAGNHRLEAIRRTLLERKINYTLVVDREQQIQKLVEQPESNEDIKDEPTEASIPISYVSLAPQQQSGSVGNAMKVYTPKPHIEER